jgi:exopolyphosphatase/guanosine-5'-triphosphate,3'-diphosphate pyrophosphatase
MEERIAVIDLGTNTFHLLIAERSGNRPPSLLHREKQPVKIGLGGINQGFITDAARDRAVACLKNFKRTMEDWNVRSTWALGTSALRSALNGKEIVERIREETGIEVRLISGDQEAEYIYYGIRSALNLGVEKSLIIDIGGGSVEFIIANQQKAFWKQSFDVGAQRLLERFQQHDPITQEEITMLDAHLSTTLEPLFKQLHIHKPGVLVGSSGTFDTLSEIYCVRNNIPYRETPETLLTLEAFDVIFKELVSRNRADRMKIPGMIEMRVDMIVMACCLIGFIIRRYSFQKVRVSTYSLKEGVLASLQHP